MGCALFLLCACTAPVPARPTSSLRAPTAALADSPPTLTDLWAGRARFTLETTDTGLPMGESDTVVLPDGRLRSYVHASDRSLGVVDQCGDPVPFPGCVVRFESSDQGRTFAASAGVMCQIPCTQCPCDSRRDHIDQQQYPRVARLATSPNARTQNAEETPAHAAPGSSAPLSWIMAYEYRANIILRRSVDGLNWSDAAEVPLTGIWQRWLMPCLPAGTIGAHPHASPDYDCLIGSPPGLYVDRSASPPELYVFLGMGQNPGSMACYRGPASGAASLLRACDHTPLFLGSATYGPPQASDASANAHFDFRTVSSAEVHRVGERYYMLYEGVRGPTPGAAGDTQFLLGLARSHTDRLDGPWEKYPGNPILLDLPGNIGVGHADIVRLDGITYLYTSLDGKTRSRLQLVWTGENRQERSSPGGLAP